MKTDLLAEYAGAVAEGAAAEIASHKSRFAGRPRGFRGWGAEHMAATSGKLTFDGFMAWAADNRDRIQKAISDGAAENLRGLDRALLEAGAEIAKEFDAAEAQKRPVAPNASRVPPTREDLMSAYFGASDHSFNTTNFTLSRPGATIRGRAPASRRRA